MSIRDSRMSQYIVRLMSTALLVVGLYPLSVQAEWMLSVYGGIAHTLDSNVTLKMPEDTHLTYHNVSWDDDSFQEPQYFGLRLTYWFSRQSPWGVAVDFTHSKMIAELDEAVSVTGRRDGEVVNAREGLGDSFLKLEFSHGQNLLTANVLYRWLTQSRRSWLHRFEPYVGLGAGAATPHVEVQAGPLPTGNYQLAGPAFQGLAGLNIDLIKHLSVFTELRLSYAHIEADLRGGGSLETDAWIYHFNIGLWLSS